MILARLIARKPGTIKLTLRSVILFFCLSTSIVAYAQDYKAMLDSDLVIQLYEIPEMSYGLYIDVSQVNLPPDSLLESLSHYKSQTCTLVLEENTGELMIYLELRMHPNWTIEEWNDYLFMLSEN